MSTRTCLKWNRNQKSSKLLICFLSDFRWGQHEHLQMLKRFHKNKECEQRVRYLSGVRLQVFQKHGGQFHLHLTTGENPSALEPHWWFWGVLGRFKAPLTSSRLLSDGFVGARSAGIIGSGSGSDSDSSSDSGSRSELGCRQQTRVKGGGTSLRKDTTSRRVFPYSWTLFTWKQEV